MNNEFFIILGLFLLITFLISTIIVIFLSKIKSLTTILEQAKEIDYAKDIKIASLDKLWTEEKILNIDLNHELEFLSKSKKQLKLSEETIYNLKEQITIQEKEHREATLVQKDITEQLIIHFDLLEKNYHKLVEKHELSKKRNESLVDDNNRLNMQIRESVIEIREEKKQNIEKIKIMKEHYKTSNK